MCNLSLSLTQHLPIIQLYYVIGRSMRNDAIKATYDSHNRPTERTIRYTIGKLDPIDHIQHVVKAIVESVRADTEESSCRCEN